MLTPIELELKNIGPHEHLKISMGQVTIVRGRNAQGKTTIQNALRSLFKGVKVFDGGLLNKDSEEGWIRLRTAEGITFTRNVTREGSELKITLSEKGKKLPYTPKAYLEQIVDQISLNPVDFLVADPADQIEYLLQSMPIELTADQILPFLLDNEEPPTGHAISVCDWLHKKAYDRRRDLNAVVRQKTATITELESTIPVESAEGLQDKVEILESQLSDLRFARTEAKNEIELDKQKLLSESTRRAADARQEAESSYRKKLQELNDEHNRELQAITQVHVSELRSIDEEYLVRVKRDVEKYDEPITQAEKDLSELQTVLKQEQSHQITRGMIERSQQELAGLSGEIEDLNSKLAGIEALKHSLLEQLPIKGLAFEDKMLFFNDVPWPKVNRAQQHRIAFQLAVLNARELPMILMDDLEHFDSENREELYQEALETGVRLFGGLVVDEELNIQFYPEEEQRK